MEKRIMFAGPSGIGKTTLAKMVAEQFNIPFISGSYSDLVEETKDLRHEKMIDQSSTTIQEQDYKLISLRHQAYKSSNEFVSDRSYFDSMAYWINKLSHKTSQCTTNDFLGLCETLLFKECTHLIVMPYSMYVWRHWGKIEDNKKRITNGWYQFQITKVMDGLLEYLHYSKVETSFGFYDGIGGNTSMGYIHPSVNYNGPLLQVLYLDNVQLENRFEIIKMFLKDGEE